MLLLLSLNNCFENYESSPSSYLFSLSLAELPFRYKQTTKHTYTHISVNGYIIAFIMVIQIEEHLEHAGGWTGGRACACVRVSSRTFTEISSFPPSHRPEFRREGDSFVSLSLEDQGTKKPDFTGAGILHRLKTVLSDTDERLSLGPEYFPELHVTRFPFEPLLFIFGNISVPVHQIRVLSSVGFYLYQNGM